MNLLASRPTKSSEDTGIPPNKHQLRSARTRLAILDAAEPLFAPHGKTGVSLREIAKEAGVDLSLVSYHFASKEALYKAVVDRIMIEFADYRNNALDQLLANTPEPDVLELFSVQIQAWFEIAFSSSTSRARLIFNKFHNSEDSDRAFWPSDSFVKRFLSLLEKAVPDKEPEFVHWTYHALMGSLLFYLSLSDRIDRISGEHCDVNSREVLRKSFERHVSVAFGLID